MTATVNIDGLKLRLLNADDESAKFDKSKTPKELSSDGARYLFENLLMPILDEKQVSLSQLDMDSFVLDDISVIYDYYGTHYESGRNDRAKLRNFYNNFKARTPMNIAVDFI